MESKLKNKQAELETEKEHQKKSSSGHVLFWRENIVNSGQAFANFKELIIFQSIPEDALGSEVWVTWRSSCNKRKVFMRRKKVPWFSPQKWPPDFGQTAQANMTSWLKKRQPPIRRVVKMAEFFFFFESWATMPGNRKGTVVHASCYCRPVTTLWPRAKSFRKNICEAWPKRLIPMGSSARCESNCCVRRRDYKRWRRSLSFATNHFCTKKGLL